MEDHPDSQMLTFRPALAKYLPETLVLRIPQPNHEEQRCILSGPWKGVVETQAWAGGHSHQQQGCVPTGWRGGGLRRACLADGRRRLGG